MKNLKISGLKKRDSLPIFSAEIPNGTPLVEQRKSTYVTIVFFHLTFVQISKKNWSRHVCLFFSFFILIQIYKIVRLKEEKEAKDSKKNTPTLKKSESKRKNKSNIEDNNNNKNDNGKDKGEIIFTKIF